MMFFFPGEEGEERGREGDCSWFENNCVYFSLYIYREREKLSSNDRKDIDGRRKVAY